MKKFEQTLDVRKMAKVLAAHFRHIRRECAEWKEGDKEDACLCIPPPSCTQLSCVFVWEYLLTHPDRLQGALNLQREAIQDMRRWEYNQGLTDGWDQEHVQNHLPARIRVHKELAEIYCNLYKGKK